MMKVKELIAKLQQYEGELEVVVNLMENDNYSMRAFSVRNIDNGWEDSGVISIEINDKDCIMK